MQFHSYRHSPDPYVVIIILVPFSFINIWLVKKYIARILAQSDARHQEILAQSLAQSDALHKEQLARERAK